MQLIAAALEDELKTAMRLCSSLDTLPLAGGRLRRGYRNGREMLFLRTGVGPKKSATNLDAILDGVRPERILLIGYAGALDPALTLGNLVVVTRASTFFLNPMGQDWSRVRLDSEFELAEGDAILASAKERGLDIRTGSALTSPHVIGNPVHKEILFRMFHASIVDMETAALAGVAASMGIPFGCVRAISDEADDAFLEPFGYDPTAGMADRTRRLLKTGMVRTAKRWKANATVAGSSLQKLLDAYL